MSTPSEEWRERLEQRRHAREQYFAENPQSPVPSDAFAGLAYYPPDPDDRFVVPLDEHDEKDTVTVDTTAGDEWTYRRWGAFHLEIGGEDVTIQGYRADPDEDRLWVPFRDATSGDATYGAGRYVDLDGREDRTQDGEWILDFNTAYNPTCAYNEAYACPLPPTENWLDVAIEAGEKQYPGEPVSAGGHSHAD